MSDDKPQCKHCQRTPEKGCDGLGNIQVMTATDTVRRCPNHKAMALVAHLGREIAGVPHVKSSPLLQLNPKGGPPIEDRTTDDLIIKCSQWYELLPHLKWVLAYKGLQFFFDIIHDQRIKNVFVGSESYKSRPRHVRDEVPVYNTVQDLAVPPDLLIIRLGQLGYKNVAAAGALKEALLSRTSLGKPTWIVLEEDNAWTHSNDADVEYFINNKFDEVTIDDSLEPEVKRKYSQEVDIPKHPEEEDDFDELLAEYGEKPPEQERFLAVDDDNEEDDDESGGGTDIDWGLPGENDNKPWKRR